MPVKQLVSKQENHWNNFLQTTAKQNKWLIMTSWNLKESSFQIINVRDDVIWTIFPYFYPYWAINSGKREYFLLVVQLFTLIP